MSGYHPAPDEDIALISRVRLARNYTDIPFAPVMNREYAEETIRRTHDAIQSADKGDAFELIRMSGIQPDARTRLVEHHLISYDLLKFTELSAALISSGETVSVMVNEEDHLRIQGLLPGMQIERSADLAFDIEHALGTPFPYAFDAQLGYLTSCPTNTGTGMRASVMLHLPALSIIKQVGNIVQAVGKLGMTVRGLYGEGSEAQGNLYQLSNQVTLGRSEEDILKSLAGATAQIAATERSLRQKLLENDRIAMEDRMMRSLGALTSARLMDEAEFMIRYSDVRLAASLDIIPLPLTDFDRLMMDVQPASLNVKAHETLNKREQRAFRAEVLREKIPQLLDAN